VTSLFSWTNSLNPVFVEHPKVGHHLQALFRNRVARDTQSAIDIGAQEMARNVWQRAQQEAARGELLRSEIRAVGDILRAFGAGGTGPSPSDPNSTDSTQIPHCHQTAA